jgi:hypothetical protein
MIIPFNVITEILERLLFEDKPQIELLMLDLKRIK